jgi:hypothetical protein
MYMLNIEEHCYHHDPYQASLIPNSCRANDYRALKKFNQLIGQKLLKCTTKKY